MLEFGHSANLKVNVPLSAMSTTDRIRLCKHLLENLLFTDELQQLDHEALRNYVASMLDKSA